MTFAGGATMDGPRYERFFLEPQSPCQLRYEAVRAVFVEEEPARDVAARMDVAYGTLRNWLSEFRQQFATGSASPFFATAFAADQRHRPRRTLQPRH